MPEFRFYHLERRRLDSALPDILEEALAEGARAVVQAPSGEQVEALNERLWTYSDESFLPHGAARDGEPEAQPVYLTDGEENPNGATMLVLVDGTEPGDLAGFSRCADLFDGNDPDAVIAARGRWRAATAAGHTLTYWQQTEKGWEKKA